MNIFSEGTYDRDEYLEHCEDTLKTLLELWTRYRCDECHSWRLFAQRMDDMVEFHDRLIIHDDGSMTDPVEEEMMREMDARAAAAGQKAD